MDIFFTPFHFPTPCLFHLLIFDEILETWMQYKEIKSSNFQNHFHIFFLFCEVSKWLFPKSFSVISIAWPELPVCQRSLWLFHWTFFSLDFSCVYLPMISRTTVNGWDFLWIVCTNTLWSTAISSCLQNGNRKQGRRKCRAPVLIQLKV